MFRNYIKRAFNIYNEEGMWCLLKRSRNFVVSGPGKMHLLTIRNDWFNQIQYDFPPKPYKTIMIQPSQVEYKTQTSGCFKSLSKGGLAQIKSGKWDLSNNHLSVDDYWVVKGLKQRFEQGYNWENTIYYKKLLNRSSGKSNHKSQKLEERIERRCSFYDELFDNINKYGYLSNHIGTISHVDNDYEDRLEVLVVISRKGDIKIYDGHHRFAIARILNIDIPAHVVCRHKEWQEVREKIGNNEIDGGNNEDIRDHPDLQDVLELTVDSQ